jgi:hypothetical protein
MADQKRWFKVWTSLCVDMDTLSNELVGVWVRLGCRAALVGTRGVVRFESWDHVGRYLGVEVDRARALVSLLPNVTVSGDGDTLSTRHGGSPPHSANEEGKTVYGAITVTFRNWTKYQEDSTQAERQKASRSKRRRDSPPPKDKEKTPVLTVEVTSSDAAPDPPGGSDLASLWEGSDRTGSDGIEGRNGRTRYPVEDLVGSVASSRSIVPTRRRVGA